MKFILAALLFYSPLLISKAPSIPVDIAQKAKPATIKVLLNNRDIRALVEVKGPFQLFCPHSDVLVLSSSGSKRNFIEIQDGGLCWGELFPGTFSFRIVPTSSQATILINGIQYKGCIEICAFENHLQIINEVDIENYLRSCLATQVSHIKESEALNALAIVARTQAYYAISSNAAWHVTAEDSGYSGYGIALQNLPLEKAITDTRHAILTYNHKPIATTWNENNAGKQTATHTPKVTIIEGMETERMKSCWSFQVSKQELAKLIHVPQIASIALFSEKESGKVYAMKVSDDTLTKTIDFTTLQGSLGKNRLKSNDFELEVLDQTIRFKGFGVGNGIGLCLHTAELMAKKGLDAKKILHQFFEDATIEKMRSSPR